MQCDPVPEHVLNRTKAKFHRSFSPFSLRGQYDSNQFFLFWWISATLEGHFREVGDHCELHNNFVKFGINAHFASYRLFNPGSHGRFHFCSYTGHSSPQSVEVLQSCLWVLLFWFTLHRAIFSKHCVSYVINVLRRCSNLISELKEPLLLRWLRLFVLKLFLKHVLHELIVVVDCSCIRLS